MAGENDNNAVISNLQQQNQLLKEKIEAIQASLNSAQEKISALEIQLPPLEKLEIGSVLATAQLTLQQSSNLLSLLIAAFGVTLSVYSIGGWITIKFVARNIAEETAEEINKKIKATDASLLNPIERYKKHNEKAFANKENENIENIVTEDEDVEKKQIITAEQKNKKNIDTDKNKP